MDNLHEPAGGNPALDIRVHDGRAVVASLCGLDLAGEAGSGFAHRQPVSGGALFAALLLSLAPAAFDVSASVVGAHYVDKASTNPSAPYTAPARAATNIQDAIDCAGSNETVFVAGGVYDTGGRLNWPSGSALTNRVVITNGVKVIAISTNPADTLIVGADHNGANGPSAVRCVYIQDGCVLSGFTLTNGHTFSTGSNAEKCGGGVYASARTGGLVTDCVIVNCGAVDGGGGGYQGVYLRCLITGNTSDGGSGIAFASLTNCTLSHNSGSFAAYANWGGTCDLAGCLVVSNNGGGLCGGGYGYMNATADRCIFMGNTGGRGGAGQVAVFKNCLIVNNTGAESGGGTSGGWLFNCTVVSNTAGTQYRGGGISGGSATNCIIYHNYPNNVGSLGGTPYVGNSCVATQGTFYDSVPLVGVGNITNDPLFSDPGAGDYHLASFSSPCFNAGLNQDWMTNAFDLDVIPRIRNRQVDMGAYELWIKSGTFFSGK